MNQIIMWLLGIVAVIFCGFMVFGAFSMLLLVVVGFGPLLIPIATLAAVVFLIGFIVKGIF